MIGEIAAGWASLNAAKDILQSLNAIENATAVNEVKVSLQSLILEAQQSLMTAQQTQSDATNRIAELEQEVVRLKDWSGERENYELVEADRRAFAYMLKPAMRDGQPPHWLCTRCFEDGKKSVLQSQGQGREKADIVMACPTCKASLTVHFRTEPQWS